jgi:integrase
VRGTVFNVGDRYAYAVRIPTSAGPATQLKRSGFARRKDAERALDQIRELLAVPKPHDHKTRAKIGDDIVGLTRRGGQLPSADDVGRRYGAKLDPTAISPPTGEFLDRWVAGRRRIKETTRVGHRYTVEAYLKPHIGDVPLDVLNAEHLDDLIDALTERGTLSPASLHQIVAVLRAALNTAVKRRLIAVNPVTQVELPAVPHKEAAYLEPAEAIKLLEATADDRDGVAFRVALLGGLRPGELVALRWEDVDWDASQLHVRKQFVHLDGRWELTDLKTGRTRHVSLDPATLTALRAHRRRQAEERLAASTAYRDGDYVFARADGSPANRKTLSYKFKQLAEQLGVQQHVRGLHAARHTSATLDLLAGTDVKVVSRSLGHARSNITQDTYQHVLRNMQDEAAVRRAALLAHPTATREAGS